MRDIGGFLILILVLFTILYLTVRFAVPFLLIYAGGLSFFTILATYLLRRGRIRPLHFGSLLKPHYGIGIALAALAVPAVHLCTLWLIGRRDHLPLIAALNFLPPFVWTSWLLWVGRRESKEYHQGGHDIEEHMEDCLSRAGLLDLKIELMNSAAETEEHPEPWEYDAGIAIEADDGLRGRIMMQILEMKQLRDEYRRLADRLGTTLEKIRQEGNRSQKTAPDGSGEYDELDTVWNRLSRESSLILNEKVGYTYRDWDQAY